MKAQAAAAQARASVLLASKRRAAEESLPLRDAFAVLFFVAVGMLFDPAILVRQPLQVLAVVAIIIVGKSAAAYLIVRAFRYPTTTALTVSASLAQIGEFSFILADLDHFKRLNDKHGHEAGDHALRVFGDVLRQSLREGDFPARWGGEARDFALAMERVHRELDTAGAKDLTTNFTCALALAAPDGEVECFVTDTGPGIPKDEIPKVLQAFGQGSLAHETAEGGTGLGLSIVDSLVYAHGGWVTVTTAPGQGCCFRVSLPRIADVPAPIG